MSKVSAIILIYDIRGFTAASKKLGTSDLGTFATAAHRTILELFAAHPPTFVKNLGDGHLLIWETTPEPDAALVQKIIAAAKTARAIFPAFVSGHQAAGMAPLPKRVGIGVAVGEVSHSDDYYGVAVNLAARLQNMARPEGLAMDTTAFELAGSREELVKQGFRKARVSLKGLGSTTVWVDRPFSWARLFQALLLPFGIAMVPVIYTLAADAGVHLPGGNALRTWVDHHGLTLFRKVETDEQVRATADADRRAIADAILKARMPDGRIGTNLRNADDNMSDPASVWGSSQAITGLLSTPHLDPEVKRGIITVYGDYLFGKDGGYIEGYGWPLSPGAKHTLGEPALWTVSAFARALGEPKLLEGEARTLAESRLRKAQEASERYHPRPDSGGWNIFPNQTHLDIHSPYTTALALLSLLETHSAAQPWAGTVERRDALLEQTARYLISLHEEKKGQSGWRRTASPAEPISEGLTLQIYAELLRAEKQTGLAMPPELVTRLTDRLVRLHDRTDESAYDAGEFNVEFTSHLGEVRFEKEAINFLWHSWAIEAAVRWLDRAQKIPATPEDIVRVRRTLGFLVVGLSEAKRKEAVEGMSFIGGETLLGYSVIPRPAAK